MYPCAARLQEVEAIRADSAFVFFLDGMDGLGEKVALYDALGLDRWPRSSALHAMRAAHANWVTLQEKTLTSRHMHTRFRWRFERCNQRRDEPCFSRPCPHAKPSLAELSSSKRKHQHRLLQEPKSSVRRDWKPTELAIQSRRFKPR
jgi:hypothetical protein